MNGASSEGLFGFLGTVVLLGFAGNVRRGIHGVKDIDVVYPTLGLLAHFIASQKCFLAHEPCVTFSRTSLGYTQRL